MEFSCEKAVLLDSILTASRSVSTKSTIQVLEGLLLKAEDQLSVCGYDLKTGIVCNVPAEIKKEGAVVLNARLLGDIIRKLPDDLVYFSCNDNQMVTIRCALSEFNLMGQPAEEFPELPRVEKLSSIRIRKKVLKSMIAQTIFAISDNEAKPVHTGSLFEIEGGKINVVSVDGFRLAIRTEMLEEENSVPDQSFVVPKNALKEVERILEETEEELVLYPDEKFILFDVGDTTVITRLLDGEFLNYKKAIPSDMAVTYEADVKTLLDSVERVSLIVSERLKNPLRCFFENNVVRLSCITAIGKAYDECALEGVGEGIEIGFNCRYLLDALRACPDEKVKIQLKGSLAPCVLTSVDRSDYLFLVLPVRLKAGE